MIAAFWLGLFVLIVALACGALFFMRPAAEFRAHARNTAALSDLIARLADVTSRVASIERQLVEREGLLAAYHDKLRNTMGELVAARMALMEQPTVGTATKARSEQPGTKRRATKARSARR